MLNFTVGPVQSSEVVHAIGAEDVPYFRTAEFSEVMLENERLMLKFVNAPKDSQTVFITGLGSASMEAAVMNLLTPQDQLRDKVFSMGHMGCLTTADYDKLLVAKKAVLK